MNLAKWKLVEYLDMMFPKDKGTFKQKERRQLLAIYLNTRNKRLNEK
jgi:hypothetical protein